MDIGTLLGKTLTSVERIEDKEIVFVCEDGKIYHLFHNQDCCENVSIEDICGDLSDLVGSPILKAEVSTDTTSPKMKSYDESFTWTFYHLATIKGYVSIRWYGGSNGYYSERVDFEEEKMDGNQKDVQHVERG